MRFFKKSRSRQSKFKQLCFRSLRSRQSKYFYYKLICICECFKIGISYQEMAKHNHPRFTFARHHTWAPRGRPWCANSVFPAFIFFRIFFSTLSCFFKILIFIKISNFLLQFPIFGFILLASLYKGNPVDILSKTLKPTSKKQFFILSKRYPR